MKENVLDVLMYLFQNYMSDDMDAEPDRDTVHDELLEAGFPAREITQAFEWLEGLVERQEQPLGLRNDGSFRIYTEQERRRLDADCQGYLLFLEQTGILGSQTRELVIDRVMALQTEDLDLQQLKWIILMVLFNHPGQEEAYAWMEDMVFDDGIGDSLH
jgi:Smg protein